MRIDNHDLSPHASGSLSRRAVLNALVKSGNFNVTVGQAPVTLRKLSRLGHSPDSRSLIGQDAVVSTVRTASLPEYGVPCRSRYSCILPSHFGSDMANPKAGVLPVYKFKTVTHKSLRKATAAKPDFTYFLVCNNGFLDWCLKKNFLLNWKESKPKLFDGSKNVLSATRLDSVEQAVCGVMSQPEETRDRFVYVKDIHISQNQFLGMAKKVEAGEKWEEPIFFDAAESEKYCYGSLVKCLHCLNLRKTNIH